jgi:hypothetical protein
MREEKTSSASLYDAGQRVDRKRPISEERRDQIRRREEQQGKAVAQRGEEAGWLRGLSVERGGNLTNV